MTKRISESMKTVRNEFKQALKYGNFDNFLDVFNSQIIRYNEHNDSCEVFLLTSEIDLLCTLTRAMFWDYRNELKTVFKDDMDYVDAVIREIHPKYYRENRVIQYDIWDWKYGYKFDSTPIPPTAWKIHLP